MINTIKDQAEEIIKEIEGQSSEDSKELIFRITTDSEELEETPASHPGFLIQLEELGKGSFGTVHRYFDTGSRGFVAEKILYQDDKEQGKGRFKKDAIQEIRNMLKLQLGKKEPLLKVYRIEYKPETHCKFMMELGIGTVQDLREFAKKEGIIYQGLGRDIEDAIKEQEKVLEEIDMAYKDFHTGNILVRANNTFILCDYGGGVSLASKAKGDLEGVTAETTSEIVKYFERLQEKNEKIRKEDFFEKFKISQVWKVYNKIENPQEKKNLCSFFLKFDLHNELLTLMPKKLQEIEKQLKIKDLKDSQLKELYSNRYDALYLMGATYARLENFPQSLEFFSQAEDALKSLPEKDRIINGATLLSGKADNLYNLQKWNEVMEILNEVLKAEDHLSEYDSSEKLLLQNEIAHAYLKMGGCFASLKEKPQALNNYQKSKKIFIEAKLEILAVYVDLQIGVLDLNFQVMEDCLQFFKDQGLLNTQYGFDCYIAQETYYLSRKDIPGAAEKLKKAVAISKKVHGATHPLFIELQERLKEATFASQQFSAQHVKIY